jgi:hypothetical protein
MRDIDVRRALRMEMTRRHKDESDTLMVEELGLCQGGARVDLAVVNGSLHGYEIKSARDTLTRLPAQSEIYNRSLEFVTIVAAQCHIVKIEKVVPSWWGIWCVSLDEHKIQLNPLRESSPNPKINPFALAQLLWRDEALKVLINHGRATGLLSKPRTELWHRLSTEFSVDELGQIVRTCLRERGEAWRSLAL